MFITFKPKTNELILCWFCPSAAHSSLCFSVYFRVFFSFLSFHRRRAVSDSFSIKISRRQKQEEPVAAVFSVILTLQADYCGTFHLVLRKNETFPVHQCAGCRTQLNLYRELCGAERHHADSFGNCLNVTDFHFYVAFKPLTFKPKWD